MKIFIDAGCYDGDTIRAFKKSKYYEPEYKIYAFDANPNVAKVFTGMADVEFQNKAVWVADEKIIFYLHKTKDISRGASVFKDKVTGNLGRNVEVEGLDFSQWLASTVKPSDYVILKMDIEGAEYDVLEKMLADNTMPLIRILILDAHYKKIGVDVARHKSVIREIKKLGIQIKDKI